MNAGTKQLGLFTLIALVVGNMIGSGVFLLPAALAPYGAASLLGWGVTLGGALLLALVYAWQTQSIRNHGGGNGYARQAFGDGVARCRLCARRTAVQPVRAGRHRHGIAAVGRRAHILAGLPIFLWQRRHARLRPPATA
jgi:amino acid transporter